MEDDVKWEFKRKVFTINQKVVSGVHPTLSRLFYPNYSWLQARVRAGNDSKHQYYGIKKGRQLDASITKSVDDFSKTGNRPQLDKLSRSGGEFWKLCELKSWTPIGSQVIVGCSELRVATRIDVVCKNTNGDIILLEIKNGYSYYSEANAMMKQVYTDRNNSPLNQHQLQLFLNQILYKKTHPHHKIANSYICRFQPGMVDVHPLAAWATIKCNEFIQCIENRIT